MRIHRTAHTRYFTVLGNGTLRKHELSFCARGLLAYLLSLPDASREDVRTLSAKSREGRTRISAALDELEAAGHYVRRTVRDRETGQVRTTVDVYEVPVTDKARHAQPPLPANLAAGDRGPGKLSVGKTGILPSGVSTVVVRTVEEPPSLPSVTTAPTTEAPASTPVKPQAPVCGPREGVGGEESPNSPETAAAGSLLARITRADHRLTLGVAEVERLAPLVLQWQQRGASERSLREVLTAGLPDVVHSAAGLVQDRLTRKLPPELPVRPAAPERHECESCKAPRTAPGRCGPCEGRTSAADVSWAIQAALRGGAAARAAMRGASV